ncbi:type VI secretion system contractile sheath domain-containing protein [Archangium lipolyticum]|uniref:type VI secretion system contractile sheath domain-containing protein n=1 Tax=Archangium lipolyticum TaxID=2970465 RepID=UPI00214A7241|nr:type VI secretion system contractile sheath large subunit [Archangium lipolyticum]
MRWLVAGAFDASPSGRRFPLTEETFSEHLGRAASGLSVTVPDRLGTGDANAYEVSFDGLSAFQLGAVIEAVPDLRALRNAYDALSGAKALDAQDATRLQSILGEGRLAAAVANALRGASSPQGARRAALAVIEEALFATARDILKHPRVARLESAWRGLHWLWTHCPASAGMDIEVLDIEPHQLVEALSRSLDIPPIQRPDACIILDASDDVSTLRQLAALGEEAWVPMVAAVKDELPPEAWTRLRADETSRWLCAAVNPVVMMAEQQGEVHRECFTSPALAVAALMSASFRDTRTFARLVGPGSATRAPAVWRPQGGATVATEVGLSLREQERLAARGLAGVSGWWDSNSVLLAAAPTVYGGRDATLLPAQLLTGRVVRLAQELAERIPAGASQDAVSTLFSRAAVLFLSAGSGRTCQLQGRLVPTGNGTRSVHVYASLKPELAGTQVQLEFTLPLRG